MSLPTVEDPTLKASSLLFRKSQKTIVIFLWIVIIVSLVAYIFQIWNAVASIRMLQEASPSDTFKENTNIYHQYQSVAIGSVTMSTLQFLLIFFLVGAFYTYFRSMKHMFQVVSTSSASPITRVTKGGAITPF